LPYYAAARGSPGAPEVKALKEVIAQLTLEKRLLKKAGSGMGATMHEIFRLVRNSARRIVRPKGMLIVLPFKALGPKHTYNHVNNSQNGAVRDDRDRKEFIMDYGSHPISTDAAKPDQRHMSRAFAPRSLFLGLSFSVLATAVAAQNSGPAATDHLKKHLMDREGLVWTGHLNPDTDSVGASMMAAHIYGGVPGVPGPINPESRYAIEQCNADEPTLIDDFTGMTVGLVDFNQSTQLPPTIAPESIVALIDHHALGGSPIVMPETISIEMRPWGSTATILADQAQMLDVAFTGPLSCVALAAILSDTVNLTLPTTTDYDRHYVQQLADQAGIEDVDSFAEDMLLAKSDLSGLTAGEIVLLDYKDFEYGGQKVGIGVAETLTAQQLIDRRDELKSAIETQKSSSGIDHLIFAIVDTRDQKSYMLWGDDTDRDLALAAFGGAVVDGMLEADGVISRKRQIGPAIQKSVESGSQSG